MKRALFTSLQTLSIAGSMAVTSPAFGEGQQAAVDFRQSAMTIFQWYLKPMGDMTKGTIPFNLEEFRKNAMGLATMTRLDVLSGFPAGSTADTDAKPEIWENWPDFKDKYLVLQQQSEILVQVVSGKNSQAMREQFGKIARVCKSCHKKYRKKK